MKTLILVRHAKSSWDNPSLADHDRPLNERGLRDVVTMGQRLVQRGVKPDLLLSSPATRAITTAEHLAKAMGIKRKEIVVIDRLYEASPDDLLAVIQELSDKPDRVMLVAHNPGLAELANHLASEITDMPTCAIAEFTFAMASWSDIGKAEPGNVLLDYPKKA
jgi:phosphohistidine phosphatase